MIKIMIFAVLLAVILAGCSAGSPTIKVVKINQTNTSPQVNVTPIVPAINVSQNVTSNITANLSSNSSLNLSQNASLSNVSAPEPLKNMTVEFIDLVGNSILIKSPSSEKILIDGGDNSDGLKIIKYIMSKGIYRFDYVFNSNPEIKNVGGLASIMFNFNNSQAYYSGLNYSVNDNIPYMHFINYAKAYSKPAISIDNNQEFDLGGGAKLAAFVPYEGRNASSDPKDDTIVFKLEYADATFLFLGDCTTQACFDKLSENDLKADVLKVNGYISEDAIEKISPKIIVYDKINNDTVKPAGVKVYSKDDGTVLIMSDGSKYFISTTGKA